MSARFRDYFRGKLNTKSEIRNPHSEILLPLSWRNWQTRMVESHVDESSSLSGSTRKARVVQLAGDGSFKNCTVQGSNPAASTSLIIQVRARAYPNWQRNWTQNPDSVGSNPTEGTTLRNLSAQVRRDVLL